MEVTIRKGTPADLENAIVLMQEVKDCMDHPEWLYLDPPEEVRQMMDQGILKLWVAEDGPALAGIFYIVIPGLAPFNYGHDLGFTEAELLRVVNMDTVAVRPAYRGMGLQAKLTQTAEASLAGTGEWTLLCTIHPENRFSFSNAVKQGYTVQKELPKYGSTRYLLRKDFP